MHQVWGIFEGSMYIYIYIYIYLYLRFVIVVHNTNFTDFNLSPQVILGLIDLNHDEVILSDDNMFPSLAIPLITRNLSYHLNWRCFVTCRQPTPDRFYKCIFRHNTNHMHWSDVTKESWFSDHQELGYTFITLFNLMIIDTIKLCIIGICEANLPVFGGQQSLPNQGKSTFRTHCDIINVLACAKMLKSLKT